MEFAFVSLVSNVSSIGRCGRENQSGCIEQMWYSDRARLVGALAGVWSVRALIGYDHLA